MILITTNGSLNNILCVCGNGAAALDYLRTITGKPLVARRRRPNGQVDFRYENETKTFTECELNPCDWAWISGSTEYQLTPVDYIK